MLKRLKLEVLHSTLLLFSSCALYAGLIPLPNSSFESPVVSFVSYGVVDVWEKTPKPDSYDDGGGSYQWFQLTGIFKNSAPTAGDHIHNCDGAEALWLFVVPEVGLFQDSFSTNGLNAKFEPNKSYTLTVGVIGGGGGMKPGATLEASLYYRDAESNFVTVAATSIVHSLATFPDKTNFIDFPVNVPVVRPTDTWAEKNIGIKFLSTVDTNLAGGYWDLDNVRLTSTLEPALAGTILTNGQFALTVQSEPGLPLEIQSSTNLFSENWTTLQTLTNFSGTTNFTTTTTANAEQIFYRALRLP